MTGSELQIRQTEKGIVVGLHVLPRAKHSGIAGIHNGALKIRVTAPPVDDAANRAIVDFLAGLFELSKSRLKILAGSKARNKTLQIEGISRADFLARISKSGL